MCQTIITIEEAKDLMEDGRGRGKEADTEKLIELSVKNGTEYGRLLAKTQAVVDKRLKGKNKNLYGSSVGRATAFVSGSSIKIVYINFVQRCKVNR